MRPWDRVTRWTWGDITWLYATHMTHYDSVVRVNSSNDIDSVLSGSCFQQSSASVVANIMQPGKVHCLFMYFNMYSFEERSFFLASAPIHLKKADRLHWLHCTGAEISTVGRVFRRLRGRAQKQSHLQKIKKLWKLNMLCKIQSFYVKSCLRILNFCLRSEIFEVLGV